jgi:hypothetical protein
LSQGSRVDELSYACAAAAISVSRNIVHIGLEIRKQRVLSGPYWFMLYTEFFSVLSLVFYAIENPDKPGSAEVLADARAGRQMIADLADKSLSAERVTGTLKVRQPDSPFTFSFKALSLTCSCRFYLNNYQSGPIKRILGHHLQRRRGRHLGSRCQITALASP